MAKISNDRVLNEELRSYLYQMVPDKLNNIEGFISVFGKDYAAKRVRSNILSVYSNEPQAGKTYAGYQSDTDKSVTILRSGKDGALLSRADVDKDPDLEEIIMHEAVHGIFTRTPRECRKYKIDSGTGIQQRQIDDVYFQISEMGRGLNEGLTEWFCEKAGFKSIAYPELTNFVRLLEKFVGVKKVMELAKGDILGRFPEVLGIPKDQVLNLITFSDELYNVNYSLNRVRLARDTIKEHIDPPSYYTAEEKAKSQEHFKALEKSYQADRQNPSYLKYIADNNLEDSLESLSKYYDEAVIKPLESKRTAAILSFETTAIGNFFLNEFNTIFNESPISEESYKRVMAINSVLNTNINSLQDEFKNLNPEPLSITFKKKCEEKQREFSTYMATVQADKLSNGTFTLAELVEKEEMIHKNETSYDRLFLKDFATSVNPRFKNEIYEVMQIATDAFNNNKNPELQKMLSKARIMKLKSIDPSLGITSSVIYGKDNIFNMYALEDKKVDRNFSGKVDFSSITLGMNESEEQVIKNFDALREQIFKDRPNAKIHISGRNILVDNGNGMSFYTLKDNQFIPMEVEEEMNLSYEIGEKKPIVTNDGKQYPVKVSKIGSFISDIKRKLNDILTRNKEPDINYKRPMEDDKSNMSANGIEVATMKIADTPVRDEVDFVQRVDSVKPTIEKKDKEQTLVDPQIEDDDRSL